MAISHVCMSCGTELCQVRARRDESLALWLVTCPACNTTCARRLAEWLARRRRARRLVLALTTLALQIGLLAGSLMAAAATVIVVTAELDAYGVYTIADALDMLRDPQSQGTALIVFIAGAGTAVGVWLRTGLARWPFWGAWLTWTALLITLISWPDLLHVIEREYWRLAGWHGYRGGRISLDWQHRAMVALLIAIVAFIAMPLGTLGRRLWDITRPARWMRQLRRRRAARGRT